MKALYGARIYIFTFLSGLILHNLGHIQKFFTEKNIRKKESKAHLFIICANKKDAD